MKRIAKVVVGALVLALAVLGVATMAGFSPFRLGQADRDHPALLKSIQDVSQIHTVIGHSEVVINDKSDDTWVLPVLAGRRTLFVAAGTVNAYVDLPGLTEKDLTLSPDGKSVIVRLPEAQLDKPNLDLDRSYMYSQDRGVLDRIADAIEEPEQDKIYKLAEKKFVDAAEESEPRKRAAENTRTFLTGILGGRGIQVTFLDEAAS